jgi:hypothetical protein
MFMLSVGGSGQYLVVIVCDYRSPWFYLLSTLPRRHGEVSGSIACITPLMVFASLGEVIKGRA